MRRDRLDGLCPDVEQCPGRVYDCRECGHEWRKSLDACPRCGGAWKTINVEHGPECPVSRRLETALDSSRGMLIRRAQRWLDDLGAGLTVTLDEISAEEYLVMAVIREESGRAARKDRDDAS